MKASNRLVAAMVAALSLAASGGAAAQSPTRVQQSYAAAARQSIPDFAGFSAERGERFFKSAHGGKWSCASCHTENPAASGRHAKTGKAITPLAPSANSGRFTNLDKTEKWFRRNCNDVLGRACTAQEKGDVLAYLLALGK